MGKCVSNINLTPLPLDYEVNGANNNDVVTEPCIQLPEPQLHTISRRWPANIKYFPLKTTTRVIAQKRDNSRIKYARNVSSIQSAWKQYCNAVYDLCSPEFWKFFLPMHTLSRNGICRHLFTCLWSHALVHVILCKNACDDVHACTWSAISARVILCNNACDDVHAHTWSAISARVILCDNACDDVGACTWSAVDTALRAAKETFTVGANFPQSTRTLFTKIKNKVPPFWSKVTHRVTIDLTEFDVPRTKRKLEFEFIDPVWAWVMVAYEQPEQDMHWTPKRQSITGHDTHNYYGGGMQYGEAFAEAYRSCPAGTFPMCVSLHWDGTSAHGMSSTPICIGVNNTNS